MKWIYIVLFNVTLVFSIEGQKHDYQWLLGQRSQTNIIYSGTTIDFNTAPPDIYYEFRGMTYSQANASMCNTSGNLLFYTNGIFIANALHEPMENGTALAAGPAGVLNQGLSGYILDQGVMALPWPEQDSLYCLLHMDREMNQQQTGTESRNFYVTLINMNANNGLGTVVYKNQAALSGSFDIGKITGAKHANGRDWWVILRRYGTNLFVRLLVTAGGVMEYSSQALGGPFPNRRPVWDKPYFRRMARNMPN